MGSVQLDNANPTILSASELPSHRQTRKGGEDSSRKHGIRDILMAKPTYHMDPFYLSEFSDIDSDDSTIEPIDEQEIYGESYTNTFSLCSFCLLSATPSVLHVSWIGQVKMSRISKVRSRNNTPEVFVKFQMDSSQPRCTKIVDCVHEL